MRFSLRSLAWIIAVAAGLLVVLLIRAGTRPAIDQLLEEGIAALEEGDLDAAQALFDDILQRDLENASALLFRGQTAAEQNDLEAAVRYWEQIPDTAGSQAGKARYLEAAIQLQNGYARDAERLLLRSVALLSDYSPPREMLVRLYFTQCRVPEITAQLRTLQEIRPLALHEMFLAVAVGDRSITGEDQLADLRRFTETDPADQTSLAALAKTLLSLGKLDEAAEMLEAARQLAEPGTNAAAKFGALLAQCRVRQGRLSEAYELLDSLNPESARFGEICRSFGLYAFAVEDWSRAEADFACAMESDPWDVELHYKRGIALERSGRHDAARDALKRARWLEELYHEVHSLARDSSRVKPSSDRGFRNIGRLLVELGRTADAIGWLQMALRYNPRDMTAASLLERAMATAAGSGGQTARPGPVPVLPLKIPGDVTSSIPRGSQGEGGRASSGASPSPEFIDVAQSAGLRFQYFNGESGRKYLLETTGGGVGILDYDGDGWPDVYFAQGAQLGTRPGSEPYVDRLFRNRGDGTFTDVTAAADLDERTHSQGCAVGDFDNDGDPDIVVVNWGSNVLFRNNGDGTFSEIAQSSGMHGDDWSTSTAFADLDRDGNLDLYIVNYAEDPLKTCRTPEGLLATCHPGNFTGAQDRLYRSNGDGTFSDVTEPAGIIASGGKGLGIATADFDGDGWQEIYVANDGTPNFLFQNTTGEHSGGLHFREVGIASGAAVSGEGRAQAGMGVACADFNADGRTDLYVTNFYGEPNTLYVNQGELQFADETVSAGLDLTTRPLLGFGAQAADVDMDGHPDMIVANGHIDDFRYRGEPWKMRPQLFQNGGRGQFDDVSERAGPYFSEASLGRGVACWDFDRDGRVDFVMTHHDRPAALLKNDIPAAHRVAIELHGAVSNRDAIGTRVTLRTAEGRQVIELCGGNGYAVTNERRQIVGVGTALRIDLLEVAWPSGQLERFVDLPVDREFTVLEGAGVVQMKPLPFE